MTLMLFTLTLVSNISDDTVKTNSPAIDSSILKDNELIPRVKVPVNGRSLTKFDGDNPLVVSILYNISCLVLFEMSNEIVSPLYDGALKLTLDKTNGSTTGTLILISLSYFPPEDKANAKLPEQDVNIMYDKSIVLVVVVVIVHTREEPPKSEICIPGMLII